MSVVFGFGMEKNVNEKEEGINVKSWHETCKGMIEEEHCVLPKKSSKKLKFKNFRKKKLFTDGTNK